MSLIWKKHFIYRGQIDWSSVFDMKKRLGNLCWELICIWSCFFLFDEISTEGCSRDRPSVLYLFNPRESFDLIVDSIVEKLFAIHRVVRHIKWKNAYIMLIFAPILKIQFIIVLSRSAFNFYISFGEGYIFTCQTPILPNLFFGLLRNCTMQQKIYFKSFLE